MNSAMRGITAKKARKKYKLEMLESVVRQQDAMIKYLNTRLEQEQKKNETIQVSDRESLPALSDDIEADSLPVEESRGTVLEGQDSVIEATEARGTFQVRQGEIREEKIIMADQTIIEAEGD